MQSTQALGVHRDVPFSDYLRWDAVSKHDLDLIARSPAHFQAAKNAPVETTPAMAFGTAAHTWILEPKKAPMEVAVMPKYDRRTKAGKEAAAEFEAMSFGKTIVTEDDARHLAAMSAAVNSHKIAARLIDDATAIEASVLWKHERTGELARCRPDIIGPDYVVDLKTTFDASKEAFAKTVHKYRYQVQAAFYIDACTSLKALPPESAFIFIAVEKKPPYGVAVYTLTKEDLERGRFQYERDITRYHHCRETGHWFGYADSINYIELPSYARNQIDEITGNE